MSTIVKYKCQKIVVVLSNVPILNLILVMIFFLNRN